MFSHSVKCECLACHGTAIYTYINLLRDTYFLTNVHINIPSMVLQTASTCHGSSDTIARRTMRKGSNVGIRR